MRVVAEDLWFPEGPVWVGDGSLLVVEIRRRTLTQIWLDGRKRVVAELGGGPNGAAIGPDGHAYVCNNGGFAFRQRPDGRWVTHGTPDDYDTGRIERVNLATGKVERLYDRVGDSKIRGPNDLCFDAHGGFWFTDHGIRHHRTADRTGIYYAKADGSHIEEVVFPVDSPNGIGLSPSGDRVYWAETHTGRVYQRDVTAPGKVAPISPEVPVMLCGLPGYQLFDSLAVDAAGNICVATLVNGGITVISPAGEVVDFVATDDRITTNICFGGEGFRTAFITVSSTGQLLRMEWPYGGLRLNYQ